MPVTIKDIALKTGLSVSAVSKALNDKGDISEEQKAKVRQIAERLGYKKNILASRLVNQKSNTLGLFIFSRNLMWSSENSAFKYLSTIMDEVKKRQYDILLFSVDSDLANRQSYIDMCLERQVEGVIYIGLGSNDPHLEEIRQTDIPTVVLEHTLTGKNISSVGIDNQKGIDLALNYLEELDHTKIAFIKGFNDVELSQVRFETYCEYMKKKSQYHESWVIQGDFSLKSGYDGGNQIAKLTDKPTAILAANDLMAIGAIGALTEQNISVPQDISVIGYDNFDISKYITPRLTTIDQNFKQMATVVIHLLFEMIQHNIQGKQVLIDPELIVRDSTVKVV
ncbi:MAG: LacI family transcriptional regulator [Spirochaetes bacterium]|nr:LacI family transcriptional regulator [Spirochaetota bacterium]